MAQDYDTGRGLSVLPGYAPTRGRSSGRRWTGHVDHRPVHAGRPPRPEHVRRVGVVFWIASFVCLLAMNVTVRQSEQPTLVLLFCFGFLVGLAMADDGLHHPGVAPAGPCPGGAVRARELLLGARSNPFLLVAVLGAVAVQLALVLVASTAAFVAVELEKWILRRQSRRSRRIPAQWSSCIGPRFEQAGTRRLRSARHRDAMTVTTTLQEPTTPLPLSAPL
jgi:hypothetical protein